MNMVVITNVEGIDVAVNLKHIVSIGPAMTTEGRWSDDVFEILCTTGFRVQVDDDSLNELLKHLQDKEREGDER